MNGSIANQVGIHSTVGPFMGRESSQQLMAFFFQLQVEITSRIPEPPVCFVVFDILLKVFPANLPPAPEVECLLPRLHGLVLRGCDAWPHTGLPESVAPCRVEREQARSPARNSVWTQRYRTVSSNPPG